MRLLWQIFGWLNVGLGVLGTVVPLLPTTPFLLVAAWAFARSSERFHDWLINHKRLGPPIVAWRSERAISRRAKAPWCPSSPASRSRSLPACQAGRLVFRWRS